MRLVYVNGALLGSAALAGVLTAPALSETGVWRHYEDHVLGTSLDIAAVAADPAPAYLAMGVAKVEIARLDPILSLWRSDSELQALNSTCAMETSPDLFRVIAACEEWRRITGGAYSARLGFLLKALRNGADASASDRLAELAAAISRAEVKLDSASRRIERPELVEFAVDGLAKGYIIDRALEAARCASPGLEGLMIDIGGDMRCWGRSPAEDGWKIGIFDCANPADNATPASVLHVRDKAVATSGVGNRAPTLVSPFTGQASKHISLATVVTDTAADADALATAFAIMAPEESIALADHLPRVSAHIVTRDGRRYASARWNDLVASEWRAPRPILAADTVLGKAPGLWPKGYSVNVEYEVPPITRGRRNEGPYVTFWITNEKNELVRTLAFFGSKERYYDENYIFWRRYALANLRIVDSVSRPTRGPGRYTLDWDGLDDRGNPVPQGKYILNIEASREHGGHGIQRIDLDIGTEQFSTDAAPVRELGQTKVSYGRGA